MKDPIIGIDLGTTYSCVAVIDEFDKPVVVKNMDNESTTPSVVAFESEENQVLVGQIAKDQKEFVHKDFIVDFIKRDMGDPNWRKEINGKSYSPQEISAIILRKLIADTSESLGKEIKKVVVTHPAYYDIPQKSAVVEAGMIAGLSGYFTHIPKTEAQIPINLIPEPTAAAYYYGVKHLDKEETVMVYDLGGGTFDVTMLKVSKAGIWALCVGGDHHLGGKDWDDAIIKYFLKCSGIDPKELEQDPTAYGILQLRAEKAKKFLSAKQSAPIAFTFKGEPYRIEISLEEFDDITSSILEETILMCESTISRASELGHNSFDKILLVGGSTRMKQVQERLKKEYPNVPIEFHEPDEAVAKGAAVYARLLMLDENLRKIYFDITGKELDKSSEEDLESARQNPELNERLIKLTGKQVEDIIESTKTKLVNITSKTFGVRCYKDDVLTFKTIIPSQSKLPAENSEPFGTRMANQHTAEIVIMETDMTNEFVDLDYCSPVAEDALSLPPGLPENAAIIVTFTIGEQGLLTYNVLHKASGNKVDGTVSVVGSMSQQEIDDAVQFQNSLNFQ